ncbi:MAG: hypothetical protein JNL70_20985 [Saprospiraceae bacterium]|nr:hypothetical protein [Saprospiraceae bacterium]
MKYKESERTTKVSPAVKGSSKNVRARKPFQRRNLLFSTSDVGVYPPSVKAAKKRI